MRKALLYRDKLKREVNIDTLQEHLEMVAFANAAGADWYVWPDHASHTFLVVGSG